MDSITVATTKVVTQQHISTIAAISNAISGIGWTSLFLGWLYYWFKKLDEVRISNAEKTIKEYVALFARDNWIEVPMSALSCLILAIFSTEIPPKLLDMQGIVSLFMVGYANSSILNKTITKMKPQT